MGFQRRNPATDSALEERENLSLYTTVVKVMVSCDLTTGIIRLSPVRALEEVTRYSNARMNENTSIHAVFCGASGDMCTNADPKTYR